MSAVPSADSSGVTYAIATGCPSVGDGAPEVTVPTAGASGAWVGTAFTACTEALTTDDARAELLAGTQTELTSEHDIAAGYHWPADIPERVLRGSPVNAGEGVGQLHRQAGAADVVTELCEGAAELLGRWAGR